jgi:DNA-binding NarL/FixJ family response regulator
MNTASTGSEQTPTAVRLLLADDHTMLREGLRRSMESAGFSITGEARDGDEAVRLAMATRPDVVLMDVTMPVLDGVEATRQIRKALPEVQVVMLTMHADADVLARALAAGAAGYLVKDASTDQVVEAVRLAASGDAILSSELAGSMLHEVRRMSAESATEPEPIITKREEEVLRLIAQGLSTPEVASALYISLKTVKNHLASIYAKLDSRDRTQAVVRAVKMGIIRIE